MSLDILTQKTRPLAISTSLGEDVLLLKSVTCSEALNAPFEVEATVFCKELDVDFNALVDCVSQTGEGGELPSYTLLLVPCLSFPAKTTDWSEVDMQSRWEHNLRLAYSGKPHLRPVDLERFPLLLEPNYTPPPKEIPVAPGVVPEKRKSYILPTDFKK